MPILDVVPVTDQARARVPDADQCRFQMQLWVRCQFWTWYPSRNRLGYWYQTRICTSPHAVQVLAIMSKKCWVEDTQNIDADGSFTMIKDVATWEWECVPTPYFTTLKDSPDTAVQYCGWSSVWILLSVSVTALEDVTSVNIFAQAVLDTKTWHWYCCEPELHSRWDIIQNKFPSIRWDLRHFDETGTCTGCL